MHVIMDESWWGTSICSVAWALPSQAYAFTLQANSSAWLPECYGMIGKQFGITNLHDKFNSRRQMMASYRLSILSWYSLLAFTCFSECLEGILLPWKWCTSPYATFKLSVIWINNPDLTSQSWRWLIGTMMSNKCQLNDVQNPDVCLQLYMEGLSS